MIEIEEPVTEVHNHKCNMWHMCANNKFPIPYRYEFYYQYTTRCVKVHPCMGTNRNTPHSEILNRALTEIKGRNPRSVNWVHSSKSDPLNVKQDIEDKEVTEVISIGGFNNTYYVIHDIGDIDVEYLKTIYKDMEIHSRLWYNVEHAFKVLGLHKEVEEMNNQFA